MGGGVGGSFRERQTERLSPGTPSISSIYRYSPPPPPPPLCLPTFLFLLSRIALLIRQLVRPRPRRRTRGGRAVSDGGKKKQITDFPRVSVLSEQMCHGGTLALLNHSRGLFTRAFPERLHIPPVLRPSFYIPVSGGAALNH